MSMDYSVSLNGIQVAEQNFSQAAQRIATANLPAPNAPVDSLTLTDFAAELVAADLAKTAIKANIKVIHAQNDLAQEALDLFA
jgi:hypothetical protein